MGSHGSCVMFLEQMLLECHSTLFRGDMFLDPML